MTLNDHTLLSIHDFHCFRQKKTFLFHLILFRAIGFYLSNEVTDTLGSSSILIYLIPVKGISIQKGCID
jgi:hypothetical protein